MRLTAPALACLMLIAPCVYADERIALEFGRRIPMRDGVQLAANVYRPADASAPVPAVTVITPYMTDNYHGWGTWFARHGYGFVTVDVRGRGNSGGTFEPFVHDPNDSYDVIEWIARQAWCDGDVGMWGISYMGTNQWAAAMRRPPHLRTIIPAAAAHPAVDFPMFNNIAFSYNIRWLTMTSGVTHNSNLSGDSGTFWRPVFKKMFVEHRPFRTLDALAGNPNKNFQTWVAHPTPDAYWDAMVPTADDYAQIDIPILTVTGHYDDDQLGALEFYRRHMQYGTNAAKNRHFLMIGPWDHGGCVHPAREVGGVKFGPAAIVDLNSLYKAWYDWTMSDGPRPDFLKKRVALYLPGPAAEQWLYADALPAVTGEVRALFLHSRDGGANDVFASGWLNDERPTDEQPDRYVYDPLDVTGAEPKFNSDLPSKLDQTDAFTLDERGVIYHTPPFDAGVDLAGCPHLTLYIELDAPCTDFTVELSEVRPDGSCVGLASDALRARYRESLRRETFAEPGRVYRYEFDSFNYFARRLAPGSRLRLLIASPNNMYWQKNYNSGGAVADETGADARVATVRIYHDADHPSALRLPILNPDLLSANLSGDAEQATGE